MQNKTNVATEVELTPEQVNAAAEAQAKAEAKAQKQAEKDAAKEAKAKAEADKPNAITQNGVKRPRADGKCGRTWAIFDTLSDAKNAPVAIADAIPHVEAAGLSVGNARAEYAQWRKFNGITGRVAADKPVLQHADEMPVPESNVPVTN